MNELLRIVSKVDILILTVIDVSLTIYLYTNILENVSPEISWHARTPSVFFKQ